MRGKETDFELDFPIVAEIKDNEIKNLDDILKFLASNQNLIRGEGNLYASVCNTVNYN